MSEKHNLSQRQNLYDNNETSRETEEQHASNSPGTVTQEVCRQIDLGKEYTPSRWDVICGRGRQGSNHTGNRRFRVIIASSLRSYIDAKTQESKRRVVSNILQQVEEASQSDGSFGFIKLDKASGNWQQLTKAKAREKIAHAFRDCMKGPLQRGTYSNWDERNKKIIETQNSIFQSCLCFSNLQVNVTTSKDDDEEQTMKKAAR